MKRLFTLFRLLDSGLFCWRLWSWLFWGFLIGLMGLGFTVLREGLAREFLACMNADYLIMLVLSLFISVHDLRSRLLHSKVLPNFLMLPMSRRKKRFLLLLRSVLIPWVFLNVALVLFTVLMPDVLTRLYFLDNYVSFALLTLSCGIWMAASGFGGNWVSLPQSQSSMIESVRYDKKLYHFRALGVFVLSLFLLLLHPLLVFIGSVVLCIAGFLDFMRESNKLVVFSEVKKGSAKDSESTTHSAFDGLSALERLYRISNQESRTGFKLFLALGAQYLMTAFACVLWLMVLLYIHGFERDAYSFSLLCGLLWSAFFLILMSLQSITYPWYVLIMQPAQKWQKWLVLSMLNLGTPLIKLLLSIPIVGFSFYIFWKMFNTSGVDPVFMPMFMQTLSGSFFSIPIVLILVYLARAISWLVKGLFQKRDAKPSLIISLFSHIMLLNVFLKLISEASFDLTLYSSVPIVVVSVLCSLLFLGIKYLNISRSPGAPS